MLTPLLKNSPVSLNHIYTTDHISSLICAIIDIPNASSVDYAVESITIPVLLVMPVCTYSAASISLFQFRYDIDTTFTEYHDIDIDIEYVSKMRTFWHCRLKI